MQVTLNWTNRNVGEDGTRIYRAETPINPLSLPAPLATVATGVTTYVDTTIVQDVVYYYRTEIFKGADKILNNQDIVISGKPYTGPGPQTIATGTSQCGFYGDTLGTELLTYAEMITAVGGGITAASSPSNLWLKFAYKGKILFIAKTPVGRSLAWKTLYDKGLVYGVDNNGTDLPSGLVGVNQNKIINVRGSEYRVRLMKGLPTTSGIVTPFSTNDVTEDLTGSEWNDLFYRLSARTDLRFAPNNRFRSVDNALTYVDPSNQLTYCQERAGGAATTTVVVRGGRHALAASVSTLFYMGAVSNQEHTTSYTSKPIGFLGLVSATAVNPIWRPVLELII